MPVDARRYTRKLPLVWPMVIGLVNEDAVVEKLPQHMSPKAKGNAYFGLASAGNGDPLSVFEERQKQRVAEREEQKKMTFLEKKRAKVRGGEKSWTSAMNDTSQRQANQSSDSDSNDDLLLNDAQREERNAEKARQKQIRKGGTARGGGTAVNGQVSGKRFRRTVKDWDVHDALFDNCFNPRDDAVQARAASIANSTHIPVSPPSGAKARSQPSSSVIPSRTESNLGGVMRQGSNSVASQLARSRSRGSLPEHAASSARQHYPAGATMGDPRPIASLHHTQLIYDQHYPGRSGVGREGESDYYRDGGNGEAGPQWAANVSDHRRRVYDGEDVDRYRPGLVIAGEPFPREIPKASVRLYR